MPENYGQHDELLDGPSPMFLEWLEEYQKKQDEQARRRDEELIEIE